jgi:hypothetical protein
MQNGLGLFESNLFYFPGWSKMNALRAAWQAGEEAWYRETASVAGVGTSVGVLSERLKLL